MKAEIEQLKTGRIRGNKISLKAIHLQRQSPLALSVRSPALQTPFLVLSRIFELISK